MEAPKIGKLSIGEIKMKPVDLRSEKQKLEDFRANDLEET